jgi:hypothetical protein
MTGGTFQELSRSKNFTRGKKDGVETNPRALQDQQLRRDAQSRHPLGAFQKTRRKNKK